jgi:hypothetical protein
MDCGRHVIRFPSSGLESRLSFPETRDVRVSSIHSTPSTILIPYVLRFRFADAVATPLPPTDQIALSDIQRPLYHTHLFTPAPTQRPSGRTEVSHAPLCDSTATAYIPYYIPLCWYQRRASLRSDIRVPSRLALLSHTVRKTLTSLTHACPNSNSLNAKKAAIRPPCT